MRRARGPEHPAELGAWPPDRRATAAGYLSTRPQPVVGCELICQRFRAPSSTRVERLATSVGLAPPRAIGIVNCVGQVCVTEPVKLMILLSLFSAPRPTLGRCHVSIISSAGIAAHLLAGQTGGSRAGSGEPAGRPTTGDPIGTGDNQKARGVGETDPAIHQAAALGTRPVGFDRLYRSSSDRPQRRS